MIECWKSSVVEKKSGAGKMMIGADKKNSAGKMI